MPRCGVCGGGISLTVVPHAELCDDDIKAKPINHLRQENKMKDYNYYTVTLDKGRITYGEVMCGDCLVPLNECAHQQTEQTNKRRKVK